MTGIGKLLVANRGEIAVRIFRTCDRLGIATVAVAAPPDRGSMHVRRAGETVAIDSYLDAAALVAAARATGADAVHPGYGFLSERAELADAVEGAGLIFVGPGAEALRRGGDKLGAKETARRAGIPVVPAGDASEIGFPLLVKAAGGGGGRGMRVVRHPTELAEALESARREAAASFGDPTVYCERFVEAPRHVEVQLLADTHGTVLALGERECSIQRRYQKILEETPSPGIDSALREGLQAAAVAFARAIAYRSAGTVEFIVDGSAFWFLELNGRIQVEHPVTETVTGVDLVEQQLRIAAGERLDPALPAEARGGHAVEVRLYAEDPVTFLPQAGRIERLRLPGRIRVDAGVEEGDEVSTAFDPMLAKLVAHGGDRREALDRLEAALAETAVEGVTTNLPFLRWLVAHPQLRAGDTSTAFLVENPPLSPARPAPPAPWAARWRLNLPAPPPAAPPDLAEAARHHRDESEAQLAAPMPGTVIRVLVAVGDAVAARQPLVVLEAMKMETPVVAPYDGVVTHLHAAPGDRVDAGAVLVEIEG